MPFNVWNTFNKWLGFSVVLGPDQTVNSGTRVILDASGTQNTNHPIVRFEWTQISGDGVTLIDKFSATPSFIAPTERYDQTISFSVVAVDSLGKKSGSAITNINVNKFIFEGSMLQLLDTLSFELFSDGELMIYPGRSNREIIKLKPSNELGLEVDDDGYIDFEHENNAIDKLEFVIFNSKERHVIDSSSDSIYFKQAEAHCRMGDLNPTEKNEPFNIGVILYIEGDGRGLVAYNTTSILGTPNQAYVQDKL